MSDLPVLESCIFCRIIKGELPSFRVYEDADVFAFLDLYPVSPGHTLVVPKGHYETLLDVPKPLAAKVTATLARVGAAVMAATGAEGFNCLQNNFAASGQIVFHSHWHVIPRREGDGLAHWPHKGQIDPAQGEAVAEAVRSALLS